MKNLEDFQQIEIVSLTYARCTILNAQFQTEFLLFTHGSVCGQRQWLYD